ncbi:MAG: hypothetical protein E7335_11650 [Clostridiales bacterium]|nr:hypothetical protein [Clostridiales bacterium]
MNNLILNTGNLLLEFSPENGALVSLTALETGWKIHRRAELGISWELLVPVNDELRNNPVYGNKQCLTSACEIENGLRFIWNGVKSERGGDMDITITVTVRAEDGEAVWYCEIENRSECIVETVHLPYLGDLNRPDDDSMFQASICVWDYFGALHQELWPHFRSNQGTWGIEHPTFYHNAFAPRAAFVLLNNEKQGLYVGTKSPETDAPVFWHMEHRPGIKSAIHCTLFDTDEISGKPVHTLFSAAHQPYIMPGETRSLMPITLKAYEGSWHKGTDIYKAWCSTWFKAPKTPAWALEPDPWLQLQINSPEDELRLRFTELPEVAKQCAKHGIRAIQLVGWNDGGQDQGNPSHTPDPRLGTFDELKQAIAQCHAMGVKIILFSKFTWADRATERFREDLNKYAVRDPYGDYYVHPGYRYYTTAQLNGINPKNLIPMCFGSEEYLDICAQEFQKVLDLGAAGMLYDECQHHGPACLCFDTSHGHRYGWSAFANDVYFARRLKEKCSVPEDFLFAGEAPYGHTLQEYNFIYHRPEHPEHLPMTRYLHPNHPMMSAIIAFDARDMINQCLLYRYIPEYEPYCFTGMPEDYPLTLEYGKLMTSVRKEYRAHLWDGEFMDTLGAAVKYADGTPHKLYSRFVAKDGTSAVVIANYSNDESITVTAELDNGTLTRYRLVDDAAFKSTENGIVIPARSAAIVFE